MDDKHFCVSESCISDWCRMDYDFTQEHERLLKDFFSQYQKVRRGLVKADFVRLDDWLLLRDLVWSLNYVMQNDLNGFQKVFGGFSLNRKLYKGYDSSKQSEKPVLNSNNEVEHV